jgi:hypothetical protein
MRRLLLLSVMGVVAVFPPGLQAQRGRAAGASFRAAPRAAAVSRGGARVGGRFAAPGRFGRPLVGSRFNRRFFISSGCYGYPYYCSGYYYPYYYPGYSDFWNADEYPQQTYSTVQPAYNDNGLQYEVDRLADEVEQLREQEQARAAPAPSRPAAEPAPTVLVFKDGHRSEVQNYGIVGQTLWVFTEHHARKYPLSDLDLAATKAANEQRGIDFVVPESSASPAKPVSPNRPADDPAVETNEEASLRGK